MRRLPLLIERQPSSAARYLEQAHTFSFEAKGGDGPLSYQWRKDGEPIGDNAPSLSLLLLQPADAGGYVCTVTDGVRSATTDTVTLTVAPHLMITEQPAGATRRTGESHTLRVAHTGGLLPISYEWKRDGVDVGGNSPELVLSGLALADAGNYWCRVRDLFETRLSQTAVLVVEEPGEGEGGGRRRRGGRNRMPHQSRIGPARGDHGAGNPRRAVYLRHAGVVDRHA
ncbi:MAG: hypothetical protein HC888_15035 [Candidatus Competibacteraceae bacterium]|nr:hypothetical protein [Candidatus Competibacteraceae bacterium]